MNFEKTRLLSADIMKLLKQIYSDQSASNLEKDLLKEKLRAMYEAIDEEPAAATSIRSAESARENGNAYPTQPEEPESTVEDIVEDPVEEYREPIKEPVSSSFSFLDEEVEESEMALEEHEPEYRTQERPTYESGASDPYEEAKKEEEPKQEEEPYVHTPAYEERMPAYEPEPPVSEPTPSAEYSSYTQVTSESVEIQTEDSKTIIHQEESIEIEELFYFQEARELSDRLSLSPIADLNKALGINDRLLTVNELFGGDYAFFDESFRKLNSMSSFEEAKSFLKDKVVQDQDWLNPVKKEKAKRFIKFIKRRYIN